MKTILLVSILLLAACAGRIEPLPQPADGYDAVKFLQTVNVRSADNVYYVFAAGSVFLADRQSKTGKVYCGQTPYGHLVMPVCIQVEGLETLLVPGMNIPGAALVRRTVPRGAFELTKVKV